MRCNLRCKFLILFVIVMGCALSAAFVLRGFIIRDFSHYMDGEAQDRIQRVIAQLEGNYELHGTWKREALSGELAWALQMGIDIKLRDSSGKLLIDSRQAIEALQPLMRKRVLETSGYKAEQSPDNYVSYPLFLKGVEIGRLDARQLQPVKEEYFISSSNRFLLLTTVILGVFTLIVSMIASRRLAQPILELADASAAIASGNLSRRAVVAGKDEIGTLANSFNKMAETIEKQEQLRRRLLSGAAHELRTPLAIISGELEGMIDGVLPTTQESLISMHDEARRLTAILNGVDEMTRAEAATLQLQCEEFAVKPFLTAITGRFESLFAAKNAVLLLDCPDGLRITADPDRLSQIMINLISNAMKSLDRGGRVAVVASVDGDQMRLVVSDNGCGISQEDLPHIFERFYTNGGGLGLGLPIVKELVTAHGGVICVNNNSDKGTSVTVSIPLQA